jgi:ATP-dependent DNA helicase RecG
MELDSAITYVKGVGPELAKKFQIIGIRSVSDLINYLPRRYEDYSTITPIKDTMPGPITIKATVKQATGRYVRRGMHITEAVINDATDSMRVVWFNQPYRAQGLKIDAEYYFSGVYELSHQRMQLMNPSAELVSDFTINTARILPIYRETKGLTSKQIRKTISATIALINTLNETLPKWLIEKELLMGRAESISAMHYPESSQQLSDARKRLGFEEVFELSLASMLNKKELSADVSLAIPFQQELAKDFVNNLPFNLTDAQRKTVWQIYLDMKSKQPMNRLVEGDVGSGKTVVAAMAALMVLAQNYQVAFMAPTELLARQHADTLYSLMLPMGMSEQITLLVGALSKQQKNKAHTEIANGVAKFLIGTSALIQEKVDMHKLGLIIIDEQHRFGVEQRKQLMSKAGHMPHVLSLTATPIPRSLALTLYGELEVSILDEKPTGRLSIETHIVSPNSRKQLNDQLREQLKMNKQIFVVCPLIAESDNLPATSAENAFEQMKKEFKNYRVGLLHGKMKADEKNTIMGQFVTRKLDILVSTTVIEVGVDVPNATVMLIESAERFGLAQIHQLRGRVGRGSDQSYCYLMTSDSKAPSRRLRALETSQDGFKLAELDLELRGPGAIYGQMQHGALDLRIASLTDVKLIMLARNAAAEFLKRDENLVQYKELHNHVTRLRAVTNLN